MRRFPVRRPIWLAISALFSTLLATASARSESFPYEARITVPGAPLHSGPGAGFYITDTLAEGQVVEVYRHRDNGWYAIRPPEDSFSWVFSSHVKLLEDSLAQIDKDNVPSRIGSRLSQRRNAVQVRLNQGEVVKILGEAEEGGQKWYKIAPPAGEFRWIHASSIGHSDGVQRPGAADGPTSDKRRLPLPASPQSLPASNQPIITISADSVAAPNAPAPLATANEWRAAPVAPPLAPLSATAPLASAADTNAESPAGPPAPTTTASPTAALATTPAPSDPITPLPESPVLVAGALDRQLTHIELRLSRMVSEPPATWQIDQLQSQAEQLLSQAQTVTERDAVKITLAKLDRFSAIARQYQQVARATQPGQPGQAAVAAATDAGRYDAVGVLRPVVSKRPGAPQFALVDERGQVVTFVTAPPEVNLQPYIGHRVGVTGSRGFIPEFRRSHLTAGRVVPLDQRLLR